LTAQYLKPATLRQVLTQPVPDAKQLALRPLTERQRAASQRASVCPKEPVYVQPVDGCR
jgi:hypothetical protein